ncbi:CPBP family intramembrane glutamic endopeptidase [Companilactobacillus metriopterae]|uniref:CPBP family intramembrane glutamic endopeptidase n=1 Tax=Companilactobacillus metriopterae TaxID=1909267 RepID=UPI00100BDA5A|nr:CPBP family intramembrane glutamic endopeptidase [Companilactobacillus metriopterae]
MEQKFIFKRQIIAITLFFFILMISVNSIFFYTSLMVEIVYLNIVFLPIFKKMIGYSSITQKFIFEIPMILISVVYILKYPQNLKQNDNLLNLLFLFLIIALMLSNKNLISNIVNSPLSKFNSSYKKNILDLLLCVYPVIAEEIFFRYALFYSIDEYLSKILSVTIVSIIFVCSHYISRWANRIYTYKSYVFQLLLSVTLTTFMALGGNILIAIFLHFIFNIQAWLPILLRTYKSVRRKKNVKKEF